MPSPVAAAVARFARAANGRALFGRTLQAAAAIAFAAAGALLLLRALGGHLPPSWWWCTAALPALLWACWRVRAERLTLPAAAAHLDRRLALDGLLLTSLAHEATAAVPLSAAFAARVHGRLQEARAVGPVLQWRRVGPSPLIAAALLAFVAQLPPPPRSTELPPGPALQLAVERLAEQLQELQRGQLPDEVGAELQQRLAELKAQISSGKTPEWSDLDRLGAELQRQDLLQQMRAEAAMTAAARVAAATAAADMLARAATLQLDPKELAAAAAKAAAAMAAAGLLDNLPAEWQKLLAQAADGQGGFDPGKLPVDAAALQQLVEAMGQCVGQGEAGGARPGRGGIDRGPGVAALQFDNDSQGGAPQVLPLPPGQAAPTDWVPIGTRPAEPKVDPVRATGDGSAGDQGQGAAAWQLHIAPRHRGVLQRYFAEPEKKDKR